MFAVNIWRKKELEFDISPHSTKKVALCEMRPYIAEDSNNAIQFLKP